LGEETAVVRRHVWGRSISTVACLGLSLIARDASAFVAKAHQAIEANAYRRLAATAEGRAALAALWQFDALEPPACLEPGPEGSACALDTNRPLLFWPPLRSDAEDFSLTTQFDSRGQCYHFMASGEDALGPRRALDLAGGPRLEVPSRMLVDAQARCTRTLTTFFREAIVDRRRGMTKFSGVYALMHSVADSYSGGHTQRDPRDMESVLFLRPWQLTSWADYLRPEDWEGWAAFSRLSHALVEDRDRQYVCGQANTEPCREAARGLDCSPGVHPYLLPFECLTPLAQHAVDATVELLLVSAHALDPLKKDGSRPRLVLLQSSEPEWNRFLERHLGRYTDARVLARSERQLDGDSRLFLGVRRSEGQREYTLELAVPWLPAEWTMPLATKQVLVAGVRADNSSVLFAELEALRFDLAISSRLALVLDPVSIQLRADALDAFAGAALEWNFAPPIGVRVTPPRMSWLHEGRFTGGWGLGATFAFDSPRWLLSLRDSPKAIAWNPPEARASDDLRTSSFTVELTPLVAGVIRPRSDFHFEPFAIQAIWDRDRRDQRRGLAYAVGASFDLRRSSGAITTAAQLSPVGARWYLPGLGGVFAVDIQLLKVNFGVESRPLPAAPSQYSMTFVADLGGQAALVISPFGAFEIRIESPQVSYARSPGMVPSTQLGIGIGFAIP
jgi:hypothetical protein